MATAEKVLEIALGEVGYSAADDPEAGSKYGRWMADLTGEDWLRGSSTEVWWCCMYVSWCLARAGQECAGFPSYNTDAALGRGPQLVYREDARPGDIIIWDWDGNGATDHIGLVLEHEPGSLGHLKTVEGNYRNSVATVDRSGVWGLVGAVIRPPYGEASGTPEAEVGPADIKYMQGILNLFAERYGIGGVTATGVYDEATKWGLTRLMQEWALSAADSTVKVGDGETGQIWSVLNVRPVVVGEANMCAWAAKAALVGKGHGGLDLTDCVMSEAAGAALLAFQSECGLRETGALDGDTAFRLTR